MKIALIQGSSRNDGDAAALSKKILFHTEWDLINLNDYKISFYDYHHENKNDDFLPLMVKLIDNYDVFIFVTPVYWYAMSGVLKVFFDRFSDLLTIEKEIGRKLRGKKMGVITCSNGSNLGEQFWLPFKATADYLGMNNIANLHTVSLDNEQDVILNFIRIIEAK
ncbi:flavodoxin family protein [Crocinitomix catalasitica]|uniref:flavodoxin family protein n=1 Tax=Crocinitomix catalasitica TaxID=184607 RepID=UPI00055E754A|nr:NAD(P)H-dependent oxidoreductase [Crocinitomix catalasitica]